MKENLVIHQAFKYEVGSSKIEIPTNYGYNTASGYWVNEMTKTPMVLDPEGIKPRTKKEDIETGEDRKGE
jgi:hypothetical protein